MRRTMRRMELFSAIFNVVLLLAAGVVMWFAVMWGPWILFGLFMMGPRKTLRMLADILAPEKKEPASENRPPAP